MYVGQKNVCADRNAQNFEIKKKKKSLKDIIFILWAQNEWCEKDGLRHCI